ncbi:MAG: glycine--tRNA ligase subunit beta [Bradymonadales bacterium]|nr:glycine--tRNA ligase subunit beta [Bradymonadales bacterium]
MDLLVEIGTEELPPASVMPAIEYLATQFESQASVQRLTHGLIERFATPRRLALRVSDVAERTTDLQLTRIGPSARAAFDAAGQPTKAAVGFARSQGKSVEDLQVVQTEKGAYVALLTVEPGRPAQQVLGPLLERLIAQIPWPKPMHWGWTQASWGRPVHWIAAMLGETPVSVHFAGIESGNQTFGHRFMSPGPHGIPNPREYERILEQAFVLANPQQRRSRILELIRQAAAPDRLVHDEELLDEVTQLVEYPLVAVGTFDPRFLALPREVLISELKEHQRYFAVEDEAGHLVNRFLIVYNTQVRDPSVVVRGNVRVLVARLNDAEFFLARDCQRPLHTRVADLSQIVFLQQLGSLRDKVDRVVALSDHLSGRLCPQAAEAARRAAFLCKADLSTDMVGEFPELQGIMGGEYARKVDGEPEEVASAIAEHYLPKGAGDRVPRTPAGMVVSMADKMDTIASCFCVGLEPTGTADPYGLRRAALGIIRITLEHQLVYSLRELIAVALAQVPACKGEPGALLAAIEGFFRVRLKGLLGAEVRGDVIDAVLVTGIDDLVSAAARVQAVASILQAADFEPLAVAVKRVNNILKEKVAVPVNPAYFEHDAERGLWAAYQETRSRVGSSLQERDFSAAVSGLIELKQPIDHFFESVLVMTDNPEVKQNRLALLGSIQELFGSIADISRIQLEPT